MASRDTGESLLELCRSYQRSQPLLAAGFVDVELIQRSMWMDGLVSARKPK